MKICLRCYRVMEENSPTCLGDMDHELNTETEVEDHIRWLFKCDLDKMAENLLKRLGYEHLEPPAMPAWQKPTKDGVRCFYK